MSRLDDIREWATHTRPDECGMDDIYEWQTKLRFALDLVERAVPMVENTTVDYKFRSLEWLRDVRGEEET